MAGTERKNLGHNKNKDFNLQYFSFFNNLLFLTCISNLLVPEKMCGQAGYANCHMGCFLENTMMQETAEKNLCCW